MGVDRIQAWKEELGRDPASLVFIPLADALRRLRRFDDARRYALRGLEHHPHVAAAHDALARVLADTGDDAQAHDEWEFALRLDASHHASLCGLGFLAYRRRDLAAAERLLGRALQAAPADDGLASALRRVREELRGQSRPPSPAPSLSPSPAGYAAKDLFATLLEDGNRTALLLDQDGLVVAGTYLDGSGRDIADEIGAHLSGLAGEATRALDQLGLGAWQSMLAEAQHATVGLAPGVDGSLVLVAAARDTQVGLVRRLLSHARQRAAAWMGVAA